MFPRKEIVVLCESGKLSACWHSFTSVSLMEMQKKTLFNQDNAWIDETSILDYFEISECQKYEQDY